MFYWYLSLSNRLFFTQSVDCVLVFLKLISISKSSLMNPFHQNRQRFAQLKKDRRLRKIIIRKGKDYRFRFIWFMKLSLSMKSSHTVESEQLGESDSWNESSSCFQHDWVVTVVFCGVLKILWGSISITHCVWVLEANVCCDTFCFSLFRVSFFFIIFFSRFCDLHAAIVFIDGNASTIVTLFTFDYFCRFFVF